MRSPAMLTVDAVHPLRTLRVFQPILEPLVEVHGPVLLLFATAQIVVFVVKREHIRDFVQPSHRGEKLMPCDHGTAPSASLWIVRYGVWMVAIWNSPEFSK